MTRVNFFKRIWLSISDFRLYPFVQKEKTRRAIWYFVRLILLCAFVLSLFSMNYLLEEAPGMIAKFDQVTPDFSIQGGKLIASGEKFTEISSDTFLIFSNKYVSKNIITIISDLKKSDTIKKDYENYMLVLDDQASYVSDLDGALYQAVKVDYSMMEDTSKSEIISSFTELEDSYLFRLVILFILTFVFAIALSINRLFTSIIYVITIWLLNTVFNLKLKLRNYIILVCYVSTLPIILEVIAVIVTKQISSAVNFICTLISFVYMFYALRAIKIDNILSSGTGSNPLEKLENAIKEAQEEIEEQLKEKAEEDKEKKEENNKAEKDENNKENNDNNDDK